MARFDEQSPSLAVSHGFRPCSTANDLDILVDSVGLGDMEGDRKGTWNGKSWDDAWHSYMGQAKRRSQFWLRCVGSHKWRYPPSSLASFSTLPTALFFYLIIITPILPLQRTRCLLWVVERDKCRFPNRKPTELPTTRRRPTSRPASTTIRGTTRSTKTAVPRPRMPMI